MQESMQAAFSYIRSKAEDFNIDREILEKYNIHVHVPEGATPKDGPSAGGAIFTAILSLLTNTPVSRYVAMTGEINLRGKISKIGGLKQKLLAALRGGITTVLIPKENENDLEEIPENVKTGLRIIPINHADDIVKHAFSEDITQKASYISTKGQIESGMIPA
jgi:ATP-dependent Lon protease